ncbi:mechanosensitive ion channel family protein [Pelagibius litoralis]|uniref:Mechanosensitive ion channel family protein n=1 Tax=Pelagibius litoralis TaxID=374515 RepID=A0A967EYN3_9PROT|nr:mechanosensitive ion channel domain-containing protein [Pelagibius litoralis]NIA69848.1 mechanosensitive ion channel family protein [Pelagibius litoralis]
MTLRFSAALALFLVSALCLDLFLPSVSHAQTTTSADTSSVLVDQWTRTLDLVEQQLRRADTTAESARRFLDLTARVRREATEIRTLAQERISGLERRMEVLGPAPETAEEAEAEEVAERRQALDQELKGLRARLAQANLAIVRSDELDRLVGTLSQKKRFEALFQVYPFPWSPDTWIQGVPEFFVVIEKIARSPMTWWQGLESEERRNAVPYRIAIIIIVAVLIGWLLRRWLLTRYDRDPALSEPSYSRRLVAAIANAMARGIVPALLFGGLLYLALASRAPDQSLFWALVSLFFAVMVFFSLAWALPYAVLSPDMPQWRLLPVSPDNARVLGRRFTLLAALFAVEIFMTEAHSQIGVTDTYFSLATFALNALPALVLIDMTRRRWWFMAAEAGSQKEGGQEEGGPPEPRMFVQSGFWRLVRRLTMILAAASILASLVGYADLGDFLLSNLVLSAISLGGIVILRGLGRELIGAFLRSDFMRDNLEIRHVARNRIKFWLRTLLDAVFAVAGAFLIASLWSSPFGEFWTEARRLLTGFTIGGVTIAFTDVLAAIIVFALILIVTRLSQRFLRTKVLPETGFDSGVQHSLAAGFGYVGIILAAVFGISALGIDLSNIALIAGALSVGIGFGLQTIVSNFVSGIILLIERPIKVGDWVMVGANEGYVKQITVRSTELQTFQRASVIIPNSDFISTAVVNWTHKDHYGRIEVPIGVAYGSDVEKVREVLLGCAARHERVLTSPEPHVLFMNFGASSLDFELRCFTNEISYRVIIASDLRFDIDRSFREAGIEIPFPQSVVHFADQAAQSAAPPSTARPSPSAGQPEDPSAS